MGLRGFKDNKNKELIIFLRKLKRRAARFYLPLGLEKAAIFVACRICHSCIVGFLAHIMILRQALLTCALELRLLGPHRLRLRCRRP